MTIKGAEYTQVVELLKKHRHVGRVSTITGISNPTVSAIAHKEDIRTNVAGKHLHCDTKQLIIDFLRTTKNIAKVSKRFKVSPAIVKDIAGENHIEVVKNMRGNSLSLEDRAKIVKYVLERKKNFVAIGNQFGVDANTVSRIARKNGIKLGRGSKIEE